MNNPLLLNPDLKLPAPRRDSSGGSLLLACPSCRQDLGAAGNKAIGCSNCHFELTTEKGIHRALLPERKAYFRQFISDYVAVRQAEGRGSLDSDYYLALPYRDLSGKLQWQWKIRALSFQALERKVLRPIARERPDGIDVLDVGAGNGWLSYQLARRGHRPVAVDLLLDEREGLGAASHFFGQLGRDFPRFQAEMDRLPFTDAQFDMVIFNAALHYSTHLFTTLREALRCLRPDGHLLIVDSPIYRDEKSGLRMREDRHQQFFREYGFRSDSLPSVEYLTYKMVHELADLLAIDWRIIRPWYGFKFALRPLWARLASKREPSKFHILWGRKKHS